MCWVRRSLWRSGGYGRLLRAGFWAFMGSFGECVDLYMWVCLGGGGAGGLCFSADGEGRDMLPCTDPTFTFLNMIFKLTLCFCL